MKKLLNNFLTKMVVNKKFNNAMYILSIIGMCGNLVLLEWSLLTRGERSGIDFTLATLHDEKEG